jgi:hypothetical protein
MVRARIGGVDPISPREQRQRTREHLPDGEEMIRVGAVAMIGVSLLACGSGDRYADFFSVERNRGGDEAPKSDAAPAKDGRTLEIEAAPEAMPDVAETDASADGGNPRDAAVETRSPDAVEQPVLRDATVDAPPDPGNPLRGQRWEVKCSGGPLPNDTRLCSSLAPGLTACPENHRPSNKRITFGGRPGARYSVTLRLRGVVELKVYSGGIAGGAHFQIGGTSPPNAVNTYGMSVSSPAQTYYVNADHIGTGEVIAALDDTVTVPIDAGASIELFAIDTDCIQLRNCVDASASVCTPYVIPAVPPAPHAFDGQFAQVDVVSVVTEPSASP